MRESVVANAERLRTNYKLIKLTGGAALPFGLDELKNGGITSTTNEVLKAIGLLP